MRKRNLTTLVVAGLAGGLASTASATHSPDAPRIVTTTKVAASGGRLTTREVTQGRYFVRTPAAWHREGRNGLRTATFLVRPASGCTITVLTALRAVATRTGPISQVRAATRGGTLVYGEGDGRAGPWRVVRTPNESLYGIASKRLAARRYGQVRVLGFAKGGCTDEALRNVGTEISEVIRTARLEVSIRRT